MQATLTTATPTAPPNLLARRLTINGGWDAALGDCRAKRRHYDQLREFILSLCEQGQSQLVFAFLGPAATADVLAMAMLSLCELLLRADEAEGRGA